MKALHNIEKLNTGYVGYTGAGFARKIVKSNSSYGSWVAYPHKGEGITAIAVYEFRLADMSRTLAGIGLATI